MTMFPQTNPKQSFPELENEIIKYWKENRTFHRSLEIRRDSPEYVFYDGPPFATGTPHYGHILAGVIKDVIPRYWTMRGRYVERKFGWDCHGLPIENIVEKKLGISGKKDIEEKIGVFEFNEECRRNVFGYVDEWRKVVERTGRWVDMDNDYKTLDRDFMESVWWVFKSVYDKGLIYESHRVVPYCPRCSTPLSNFEVNQGYEDKQDKAVTVKFKVTTKPACAIVVENEKGEILLGKSKKGFWSFPGGKVEEGESFTQAACRELFEETGIRYDFSGHTPISEQYDLVDGKVYDNRSFYVRLENTSEVQNGEPEKFYEWKFFPKDALPENLFHYSAKLSQSIRSGEVSKNTSFHILAWTTTPWTLPANLGLAVGKDIEYAEIRDKASGEIYVLAKDRIATYYKNVEDYQLIREYLGAELLGLEYEPLFSEPRSQSVFGQRPKEQELWVNAYHVVSGHHVTTESGTGVVHIAPAYGEDDSQIGKKEHLGLFSHIDATGHVDGLGFGEGEYVFDFNETVIRHLKEMQSIVHIGTIDHSYPHCYRCHTPLIYRAISAWYVNVEKIKDAMITSNSHINWTPENIKEGRFGKWLEGARDWNISRNRYWGSALPVWKSEDGDVMVIGSVRELAEFSEGQILEKNGDYVFADTLKPVDIHKHFVDKIVLWKNGKEYHRIPEVLDCWFESGSMPYAQKHYPFENKERFEKSFPADFICEGVDQTRGWFYTLVVLSAALYGYEPFKNVIVNGTILAEDGKKMSKSLQNYPDPMLLLEKHGADAVRFFLMNSSAVRAEEVRFSETGVEEAIKRVLLPLWNTLSFFTTYANIDGWEPDGTEIDYVRHGQTPLNIPTADGIGSKRVSGGTNNLHLTEEGREQCLQTGKRLASMNKRYDIIIHTGMNRTIESAEIIARELGFTGPIEVESSLAERVVKEKYDGALWSDILQEYEAKFGHSAPAALHTLTKLGGCEADEDFEKRVLSGYQKILERHKGKKILIVAHGNVFRMIASHVRGIPFEEAMLAMNYRLKNAEVVSLPVTPTKNPLDRFILGELQSLIARVTDSFESYDLQKGARAIVEFMDDLTNWYVRRSRRRFWEQGMGEDKKAAYETLHCVLVNLSKILAPYAPFMSEYVFRALTNGESVHLEFFPEFERTAVSQGLIADMKKAKDLVALGLSLRSKAKIRVRQPLARLIIGEKLDAYYLEILKEELNVKEVVIEDMAKIAKKICKPNARTIGPRFGKSVQEIITTAKSGNFQELTHGRIQVGEFILEANEFEIAYEPLDISGLSVEWGNGMVVAMDIIITEELRLEGVARDLVRVIQDARKEAGYSVSDRILLSVSGDSVPQILTVHAEYLSGETLSTLSNNLPEMDVEKIVDTELGEMIVRIRKA